MKKYYQLTEKPEENVTELYIYGDITEYDWWDGDVSSLAILKELKDVEGDIVIRINSYGGSVKEALAIYSLLREHAKNNNVTTICDGFACSAASVVFMAGTKRVMNSASLLMIHNAWTYASGDHNAFAKAAEDLKKITQPSVDIYVERSNLSREEITKMMDEETWITAEEALEYGFSTATAEEQAEQSADKDYMLKQVRKNKKLEQRIKELESMVHKDPWDDFFN